MFLKKFCGVKITIDITLHEGFYLHFTETIEIMIVIVAHYFNEITFNLNTFLLAAPFIVSLAMTDLSHKCPPPSAVPERCTGDKIKGTRYE